MESGWLLHQVTKLSCPGTRRRMRIPAVFPVKYLRNHVWIVAAFLVGYLAVASGGCVSLQKPPAIENAAGGNEALVRAMAARQSHVEVQGSGLVTRVLTPDRDGSRHQRFIVSLDSGQTILIAHNIDLAQSIDALREGDRIEFKGEYEWNPKGGIIHWTHHDPSGRHLPGWIQHNGQIYQ